jgi:hypothetical protein
LDLVIQVAKSKGYQLPTDYQLKCLNVYINELISNGIWQRRDLLYVHGFNTLLNDGTGIGNPSSESKRYTIEKFASLNFKSPLQYELTRVTAGGTSARFPYLGAQGWGNGSSTTSYLSTGWAQTNAVNWQQNSASFSLYISDNTNNNQGQGNVFGIQDTTANRSIRFFPWNASNVAGIRINTTAGIPVSIGSTSTNIGYWHGDRSASNLTTLYYNGVSNGTVNTASQTLTSNIPLFLTATNQIGTPINTFNFGFVSSFALGASLGATLQKIDFEIFTQFKNKLGY